MTPIIHPFDPVCAPDALDLLLLHRLRTASAEELRRLPMAFAYEP